MKRSALLILAAATMLLLAPPVAPRVSAATLEGVTFPDAMQVDGRPLYLNGIGLRTLTVLNVRVYVAGLYLERRSHDARAIEADPGLKVIVIHYLRGGSKEQVERQFRAGERVNCGAGGCPASDQADFERRSPSPPRCGLATPPPTSSRARGWRSWPTVGRSRTSGTPIWRSAYWTASSATGRRRRPCAAPCSGWRGVRGLDRLMTAGPRDGRAAHLLPCFKRAETFSGGASQWRGGDGLSIGLQKGPPIGLF